MGLELKKEKKFFVIDSETGEYITDFETGDRIVRKKSVEYLKNKGMNNSDIENIIVNKDRQFIKIYRDISLDLVKEDLTKTEHNVVLYCLGKVNYSSGAIASNKGRFISGEEMALELGVDSKSIHRAIARLVQLKILHKGETGKEYQLFANPFIFMRGSKINDTLYSMFKKSKWARKKGTGVVVDD